MLTTRKVSILISGLVVLAGMFFYFIVLKKQQQFYNQHHVSIEGTYLLRPKELKEFNLIDNNGKVFTKNNLKGRWSLIFFGFTHCQMVCPITMAQLSKTYQILQTNLVKEKMPQVIFVSLDPERDSIKKINDYVKTFNPKFIGAVTSKEQVAELKKVFPIVVKRNSLANNKYYQIDHSSEVLLINTHAQIQAFFPFPINSNSLAHDYKKIISK